MAIHCNGKRFRLFLKIIDNVYLKFHSRRKLVNSKTYHLETSRVTRRENVAIRGTENNYLIAIGYVKFTFARKIENILLLRKCPKIAYFPKKF